MKTGQIYKKTFIPATVGRTNSRQRGVFDDSLPEFFRFAIQTRLKFILPS